MPGGILALLIDVEAQIATIDAKVDAVLVDTSANLPAQIAAERVLIQADIAAVQIVVDAFVDFGATSMPEPTVAPAFPMTPVEAVKWIVARMLHVSVTNKATGVETLKQADGLTQVATATHSADATDVTKGAFS